jgi:hypothetical protein
MPVIDEDGEINVNAERPDVQALLNQVTGKYQRAVLALILIGLPSETLQGFSNGTLPITPGKLLDELLSFGFSPTFARSVSTQALIDSWLTTGAAPLTDLRAGLFSQGLLDVFEYSSTDPRCPESKALAMVRQARAAETAVRTYILQENNL